MPIINVRGICCLAFDPIVCAQFDAATTRVLQTGAYGVLVEGYTYGISSALIYKVVEIPLFYVDAVLITRGTYTYLKMGRGPQPRRLLCYHRHPTDGFH